MVIRKRIIIHPEIIKSGSKAAETIDLVVRGTVEPVHINETTLNALFENKTIRNLLSSRNFYDEACSDTRELVDRYFTAFRYGKIPLEMWREFSVIMFSMAKDGRFQSAQAAISHETAMLYPNTPTFILESEPYMPPQYVAAYIQSGDRVTLYGGYVEKCITCAKEVATGVGAQVRLSRRGTISIPSLSPSDIALVLGELG